MTAQGATDPLTDAFAHGAAYKQELLTREGGVLSEVEVGARLEITCDEVRRRRDCNELFHLKAGDQDMFPAFQFGSDGLLSGVRKVLAAFAVADSWMRVNFMLTGDWRLSGARPIDALQEGRVSEVIRAAGAYGEHGAA